MLSLHTSRLDLIAATPEHLEAELGLPPELAALLGARVPEGWPPGEYDRSAIEFFRDRLKEIGESAGWYSWYVVWRPGDGQPSVLVGTGGYFGPPDTSGTVEIGYSIVPVYRARGFATEIVRALVERAFSIPSVKRVIAHTQAGNPGSIKVLERSGFSRAGAGPEPGTVQYARLRPAN